eukprot:TRINITY_DN348_c0_g1_i14.p1 TRINITY_DN348_c0_g1~~TRINITY_DN348_c0_g1_i14.p1  ORF type:complete len:317 (+),score=37.56 TRINITY_DN348_c0_g1_i14:108-1058(+)
MYSCIVLMFTIIPSAFSQVTQEINALGATPSGLASGQGVSTGDNVQGTVEVSVDETTSRSSVVLTASGNSPPKIVQPYPSSKPTHYKTHIPVPVPQKVYTKQDPICEDIKDDKCYGIHEYKKCGFCVQSKYPTKGYGCSYTEEVILKKKGDSKKEYEYETKIVPKCDCDSVYIIDGYACPSCDSLLKEILTCAGTKSKVGEVEIPEKCLKQVGVSEKELIKCGFLAVPKPQKVVAKKEKETSKLSPKPVIIKKEVRNPSPGHVVLKKEDPMQVVVSKPTTTSAITSASASATSTSQGKGSIASASASATVTSGKHH